MVILRKPKSRASIDKAPGPSTAAFDHRPAAIVLDDGVTSFFATYPPLPDFLVEWIKAGRDEPAIPVLE
jgi:hypothetical protein